MYSMNRIARAAAISAGAALCLAWGVWMGVQDASCPGGTILGWCA